MVLFFAHSELDCTHTQTVYKQCITDTIIITTHHTVLGVRICACKSNRISEECDQVHCVSA